MIYRRIGLSGAHCYLAHTALIERKFGVGKAKYSTTGQEQARSANEDHFAMGSLLQ